MAAQILNLVTAQGVGGLVTVDLTFDDVTGEVTAWHWSNASQRTVTATITNPVTARTATFTAAPGTSNASVNVPNNRYFLVKNANGDWDFIQANWSITVPRV